MSLSARAIEASNPGPELFFWKILGDLWHPKSNPNGYVSLGTAENTLMHDVLKDYVNSNICMTNPEFTYGDGKKRLKAVLSRFLTRYFNPVTVIEPDHITITNGCCSAIEHCVWAFGNPGDVILLGRPFYGTFKPHITLRMGTKLGLVSFNGADPLGFDAVEYYEEYILSVMQRGHKVSGLLMANPHNPLGRCYPKAVIVELMRLCQRYRIHLISDEIYALSQFENTSCTGEAMPRFESVLSIDTTGIIDQELVHVIWGVSKDFGANGLRMGAIVSQSNPVLHRALHPVSLYTLSSSLTDHVVANMLDDEVWVENYIRQNKQALRDSYNHVTAWARDLGIQYAGGTNAAFFIWVDLGSWYMRIRGGLRDNSDNHVKATDDGQIQTNDNGNGHAVTYNNDHVISNGNSHSKSNGNSHVESNGNDHAMTDNQDFERVDCINDELCHKITDALLKQKVFLAAGNVFGSEKPGWFRIVFSCHRTILDEGLKRIEMAIHGQDSDAGVS